MLIMEAITPLDFFWGREGRDLVRVTAPLAWPFALPLGWPLSFALFAMVVVVWAITTDRGRKLRAQFSAEAQGTCGGGHRW